ncbi:MAG: hypothetical protein OEY29_09920 [Gammaproteobacteria bacterium]|nr:hypothetical protein [Gammaproteobacteria bacterium]
MERVFKECMRLRYIGMMLIAASLISCNAFDFNGENISPVSSSPIVYVKRPVRALAEPIDPAGFAAGGDLYWRDAASASAEEINLTRTQTAGGGDVSSPEVSYDGTKVVFSMRRPADNSWNIWLLDVSTKQLIQLTTDDASEVYHDLHPHFLADGRIVFASDRQLASRAQLSANSTEAFSYLDPKGRHPASLLHVMEADGSNMKQISFHVGHDRDVSLLANGKLMFNRWEVTGQRNHFPLITMNPDGSGIQTLYGAYSKGNSFLSPRQLENGHLIAVHAPVSGAHGGGALVEIDIEQYGDLEDRISFPAANAAAQKQLSLNRINIEAGVSAYGRFLSPYPLADGSNRILVSWSASNKTQINDLQNGSLVITEGHPSYGIYIMDLGSKSMTPIVPGAQGVMAYDAVSVEARTIPALIADAFSGIGGTLDATLETAGQGAVHIRSVYDTDMNGLLGPSMLVGTEVIAQTPSVNGDVRPMVADLATIKNRVSTPVDNRVARFVRISKAVPVPQGAGRDLPGDASGVMQQILGYSEVEADGSVMLKIPADTPVAISVLDAQGRAITNHNSWLQVRPGETLQCAGCHSPRRRAPLNVSPVAGNHPIVQLTAQSGETMAKTRARINSLADLNPDIVYTDDVWITDFVAASTAAGQTLSPAAAIDINYSALTTAQPVGGVINFVEHIQPIFDANCVSCHNGTERPDLRALTDTDGVLLSYKNLIKGPADLDPLNPVLNLKEGAYLTQRQLPYVMTGGPRDSSRNSYLTEKLYNTELRARRVLSGSDHSVYVNASEMRLLVEWMDTGGNYYNSPFGADVVNIGQRDLAEVIGVITAPDFGEFKNSIKPVLDNRCASCHKAIGNKSDFNQRTVTSTLVNPLPSEHYPVRFVLTGDDAGDYRAAMAFIEDRSAAAQNSLISRPLSNGLTPLHPQISDGAAGFIPVLQKTDADYTSLVNWITP